MGKKRKSDASRLDEVDRGMYTTFCSAANSLSQLYTHAMHQQRLSFQAGERHSMEKLHSWILRQEEDGARVTTVDIVAYLQNELDLVSDEPPPSPRPPPQQQQPPQTLMQLPHSGPLVSSNAFGLATHGQTKSSVFSNALSSPVRRSLQNYHLSNGSYSANTTSSQNRDNNPPSSNDTSMDMHADSPGHDSPY
ncbi:hypothetical protein CASFOL_018653 [Castilleja foliolosa]|uniref:Holocarboxylase synthetase n=1 Tax=Castilleja foliolosa TaxID=1961234 RepID=A0ABD3D5A9_9LAMI